MNKIIKEYDKTNVESNTSSQTNDLNNEIKHLEEENTRLKEQIKMNVESNITFPASNSFENNDKINMSPTKTNATSPTTVASTTTVTNLFDNFSPQFSGETRQENGFALEDPFQVFDPFNNNDPFKSAPINNIKTSVVLPGEDPFANAFDPFNQNQDSSITSGFGSEDPFGVSFLIKQKKFNPILILTLNRVKLSHQQGHHHRDLKLQA